MLRSRYLLTFTLIFSTALAGCVAPGPDDDRPAFTRVDAEPEDPVDDAPPASEPVTPPPSNTTTPPPANESAPPEEPASVPAPVIVKDSRVYAGAWRAAVRSDATDTVLVEGSRGANLSNPTDFLSARVTISWTMTQGTNHVSYALWDAAGNTILAADSASSPVVLEFGANDARLVRATRVTIEPALLNASADASWEAAFDFLVQQSAEYVRTVVASGEIVAGASSQDTPVGHDFAAQPAEIPASFASASLRLEWLSAVSNTAADDVVLRFLNDSGATIHEIVATASPFTASFDANDLRIARTRAVAVVPAEGSVHAQTTWTATLSFLVRSTPDSS